MPILVERERMPWRLCSVPRAGRVGAQAPAQRLCAVPGEGSGKSLARKADLLTLNRREAFPFHGDPVLPFLAGLSRGDSA